MRRLIVLQRLCGRREDGVIEEGLAGLGGRVRHPIIPIFVLVG